MKFIIKFLLFILFISPSFAEDTFPENNPNHTIQICKDASTKRGVLDEKKFGWCIDDKNKGYELAEVIYNEFKSEPYFNEVITYVLSETTKRGNIDYQHFYYELEKQKEAILDLKYLIKEKKVNESQVNKCSKEEFPNIWAIVYCLEG